MANQEPPPSSGVGKMATSEAPSNPAKTTTAVEENQTETYNRMEQQLFSSLKESERQKLREIGFDSRTTIMTMTPQITLPLKIPTVTRNATGEEEVEEQLHNYTFL